MGIIARERPKFLKEVSQSIELNRKIKWTSRKKIISGVIFPAA